MLMPAAKAWLCSVPHWHCDPMAMMTHSWQAGTFWVGWPAYHVLRETLRVAHHSCPLSCSGSHASSRIKHQQASKGVYMWLLQSPIAPPLLQGLNGLQFQQPWR